MHDRELLAMVGMRMRIDIRRFAVRCPTGMADTGGPYQRSPFQLGLEVSQAADRFGDLQSVLRKHRNPRRIIPAVLQLLQSFQQNRLRVSLPDISNDTTHNIYILRFISPEFFRAGENKRRDKRGSTEKELFNFLKNQKSYT
ncbi:hypothetical protein D1872_278130 [compost metagenome]